MTTQFMCCPDRIGIVTVLVAITLLLFGLIGPTPVALHRTGYSQKDPASVSHEEDDTTSALTIRAPEGSVQQIIYEQTYEGVTCKKEVLVYVSASYTLGISANIVYLMHG